MTELLNSDDYETQTGVLTAAIMKAGDEVNTAVHKERTGAGDAAATKKARDHRAALVSELDDVRAAWHGAQAEAVQERAVEQRSKFDHARSEIRGHLAAREAAVASVLAGLKAVVAGCEKYHSETALIRAGLTPFQGHGRPAHETSNSLLHLGTALSPQVHLINLVNTAIVGDGRFRFIKHPHAAQTPPEADPVKYEAELTAKALSIVDTFSPGLWS
jgi:hypothetical protein